MLDPDVQALFGPGTSLIVGTVSRSGEPSATRAFAVRPADDDWTTIRVVVGAQDPVAVANLVVGNQVAVTGADVRTLRSAQIKGPVVAVEAATPDDLAAMAAANERFVAEIHDTDGTDPDLVWRIVPAEVVVIEVERHEHYDQSPGPSAGARLVTP